jgi:hypothetical protein
VCLLNVDPLTSETAVLASLTPAQARAMAATLNTCAATLDPDHSAPEYPARDFGHR